MSRLSTRHVNHVLICLSTLIVYQLQYLLRNILPETTASLCCPVLVYFGGFLGLIHGCYPVPFHQHSGDSALFPPALLHLFQNPSLPLLFPCFDGVCFLGNSLRKRIYGRIFEYFETTHNWKYCLYL